MEMTRGGSYNIYNFLRLMDNFGMELRWNILWEGQFLKYILDPDLVYLIHLIYI